MKISLHSKSQLSLSSFPEETLTEHSVGSVWSVSELQGQTPVLRKLHTHLHDT